MISERSRVAMSETWWWCKMRAIPVSKPAKKGRRTVSKSVCTDPLAVQGRTAQEKVAGVELVEVGRKDANDVDHRVQQKVGGQKVVVVCCRAVDGEGKGNVQRQLHQTERDCCIRAPHTQFGYVSGSENIK